VSFRPEGIAAHKAIYNFGEFDPEDMTDLSGNSVFYKNERGEVFHTYGTFGRGGEQSGNLRIFRCSAKRP
jgi:predicted dithiol-disulfide oxidoreductase (DUF899 family)